MSQTKARKCNQEVSRIRSLLQAAREKLVDAMIALRSLEEEGTWKYGLGGSGSFEEFVQANFPGMVDQRLYRSTVASINAYGEPFVRSVGPAACPIVSTKVLLEDDSARRTVVRLVEAHVRKRRISPTLEELRAIVRSVAPKADGPGRKPRLRVADLLRENEALRRQLSEVQSERDALKRRVEDLEREAKVRKSGRAGRIQIQPS